MTNVRVNLGQRSYDIAIATDEIATLGRFARERCRGTLVLVVTDEHAAIHARTAVGALEKAGYQTTIESLPAGEIQKSLATASRLYDRLADLRADRQSLIVAVGGGVIGDLSGFVAATYARGLPLLMVPTTLLAMVDSSVGGKVAVNHPKGKNLIGAFHQPVGVWIDTTALDTLPDREYKSGLAEVVKYGMVLDAEFFSYLETHADAISRREPEVVRHVIARCCRIKADVVEKDEREETGHRMILNYGHTFAHAFETAAGYGRWLHGEAVAAGMRCAARLAEQRGLVSPNLTTRQDRLLSALGLPISQDSWSAADLIHVMQSDKKAQGGRLRFVLPCRLGEAVVFDDVTVDEISRALTELNNPERS
jgi:3-dehydroquinate synthase